MEDFTCVSRRKVRAPFRPETLEIAWFNGGLTSIKVTGPRVYRGRSAGVRTGQTRLSYRDTRTASLEPAELGPVLIAVKIYESERVK